MRNRTFSAVLAGLALTAGGLAFAQGAGNMNAPNSADIVKTPDVTPDQRQLRDDAFKRNLDRKRAPSKDQIVTEVSGVFAKLKLSCAVTDARLVGKGRAEGSSQETKTYEAACDNSLGYFVVSSDTDDAFSCFAAEATRDKDIAAGQAPGAVCVLPANADSKTMATTILAHAGVSCHATKVRWIGLSAKAASEYTEVACSEGGGYVLTTAVPGSQAPVSALACTEAAKRGIFCTMSPTAQPAFTLQTFRDELARRKVVCSASNDTIRHIGQETTVKRHVVEFKCPEFPKGIVAYIPLSDSKAPFEVIDCPTAAKRGAACKLQP